MSTLPRSTVNSPRMSVKDAAIYVGVSYRTMKRMIKARVIQVQRITRRKHLIRQTVLDRYLQEVES